MDAKHLAVLAGVKHDNTMDQAPDKPMDMGGGEPEEHDEGGATGESITGAEWKPDELERLKDPEVAYMELTEEAGAFSCGTCTWAGDEVDGHPDSAECMNESVNAPVSATHGCCNFFEPADKGKLSFPSEAELKGGYEEEAEEVGAHNPGDDEGEEG